MLRTIMFQCFGIRSASVYPGDILGKAGEQVGHIEHGSHGRIDFAGERFWLIKTHGLPRDRRPAIYVVRNGRDATISYYTFMRGQVPLPDIVEGRGQHCSWAQHLTQWNPLARPNTLLLRYEEMVADLGGSIDAIARFLGTEPVRRTLPDREALADGQWVVSAGVEKPTFGAEAEAAFQRVNGEQMRRFGYV